MIFLGYRASALKAIPVPDDVGERKQGKFKRQNRGCYFCTLLSDHLLFKQLFSLCIFHS